MGSRIADRRVDASVGRHRLSSPRDDVLLTAGIIGALLLVVAGAALLLRPRAADPSCIEEWGRLSAAVSAFQADGGGVVSEEALLVGNYVTAESDYFDVGPDGSLTPAGPAPVACA